MRRIPGEYVRGRGLDAVRTERVVELVDRCLERITGLAVTLEETRASDDHLALRHERLESFEQHRVEVRPGRIDRQVDARIEEAAQHRAERRAGRVDQQRL